MSTDVSSDEMYPSIMHTQEEYVEAFKQAVTEYGWRLALSPGPVIGGWDQLVDFVEEGYDDNSDEYYHDLAIRGLIEHLLHPERLGQFVQFGPFRQRVALIDKRFRDLLQPEPVVPDTTLPWWEAHAPRYAGPQLAADMKNRYGITIEVRNNPPPNS